MYEELIERLKEDADAIKADSGRISKEDKR